jgi:hypothetical protein
MTNPQKNKGDRAEREVAAKLADLTGWPWRRKLGAGRCDDTGDLDGLEDWTVEVKDWTNVNAAVSKGLADLEREQANAGTAFGVALIRRRGGKWFAAMPLENLAAVMRELS